MALAVSHQRLTAEIGFRSQAGRCGDLWSTK